MTDTITLPRATVQQALEAWEGGGDSWRLIWPAIDALKAALEQPEQVDVLAEYTGDGTHRQWVSTGAWLMPGERVLHAGAGHPPRREWKGLTDEEIKGYKLCGLVRDVEAKLKERNA